jgi:3' exoribonuclease, RNase T-like
MNDASPEIAAFDDVMVDIESMSLHPHNALILSIGMVEFNPRAPQLQLGRRCLILPSIAQQAALCRHVDPKTQSWWAAQAPEAKEHWLNPPGLRRPLIGACNDVWIFLQSAKRVWANGVQFDLSNIVGLFGQLDLDTPWHYRAPRDMRTFCEETPQTRGTDIGAALDFIEQHKLIDHEPVSDCIKQAYRVWGHSMGGHDES